jgi:hypothetical protein
LESMRLGLGLGLELATLGDELLGFDEVRVRVRVRVSHLGGRVAWIR